MSRRAQLRFVTFLTIARYPLVLIFLVGAVLHTGSRLTWLYVLTLLCLIASAVTDLLDGYFARRFKVETKFGAHVDPLMDKFFYLAALPLLVFVATKNAHDRHAVFLLFLTVFFLSRDQWVTFLRSIGSIYNARASADWSGKLRTCINFPLICFIYHFEEAPPALRFVNPILLHAFECVAVVVNGLSVYTYTRRFWPYLHRSASMSDHPKNEAPPDPSPGDAAPSAWLRAQKTDSLTTMATGVAHDLNNILTAILGNKDIILRSLPSDSPSRVNLRQIEESAAHGLDMANKLLDYTGIRHADRSLLDLSRLVRDMRDRIGSTLSKDVSVRFDLVEPLPLVSANPAQIQQVVLNLTANASEAIEDHAGAVTVSTGVMTCDGELLAGSFLGEGLPEGRYVYVDVADTGHGIPDALVGRIFEPFFTTKIRGQGLGLAVVLGILRAHQGTILVTTRPQAGSSFRILLQASEP